MRGLYFDKPPNERREERGCEGSYIGYVVQDLDPYNTYKCYNEMHTQILWREMLTLCMIQG